MRVLVVGGGAQGTAAAFDLVRQPAVERVTMADLVAHRSRDALPKCSGRSRKPFLRLRQ